MDLEFRYDFEKDRLNCIKEERQEKKFSEHKIQCSRDMADLLAMSQPRSIFNRDKLALNCFGAKTTILRRAVVLPNSYELFLSPWLADGTFSYPHERIKKDWKEWFPSVHNASPQTAPGITVNKISDSAFDGTTCLLDKRPKFVIKNHIDANNYWIRE